jgi:heme/copper-type cytochrome/quinol oxidase subunit 1
MSFIAINYVISYYEILIWSKARVIYYVNNWVYTTNHKRIAVNYFWFVIFAGICGMVLATIIRLEMAYPGVGILAGDSLQYLSVVTAHAVIMVFFMIIPLMFGAFANFLLPTQLGVHDVAFPRLNSAAFWFLPAGLIMLCQLVCLDRRYQRMNCFNIREIQALLKGRFFTDLINNHDHHEFLDKTVIIIRFKSNNENAINPGTLMFYRDGIFQYDMARSESFFPTTSKAGVYEFFSANSKLSFLVNYFSLNTDTPLLQTLLSSYTTILCIFNTYTWNHCDNVAGNTSAQSSIYLPLNFIKTEVKKASNNFLNILNFNEPSWLFVNYYSNYISTSLDNIMLGVMDNNIGFHKTRQVMRPKQEHPEIITNGSLPEFVFTYLYHIASRSVLIPIRNFKLNLDIFIDRWTVRITNLFHIEPNSSMTAKNNVVADFEKTSEYTKTSDLALFLGNLTSLSVNALLNVYITASTTFYNIWLVGINFDFYLNTLTNVLSRLLSLNTFIGLNDFSSSLANLSIFKNTSTSTELVSDNSTNVVYSSKGWNSLDLNNQILFNNVENSLNFRYQKSSNPIFRYDYKAGNYITTTEKEIFTYLFPTISELTGGIRKSSWFFSETFMELFDETFSHYTNCFSVNSSTEKDRFTSVINSTDGFYNFFYLLSTKSNFINKRWLSINSMDQKFYRMFTTSSMQQRIYSNWRQLKFTREAWRCKLLAARHQKTMYRRYVTEDNIFWSVERNAKDVLPGWAMITPFSARTRFTAIGKVDIGLMGVFLVLNSSIVSAANFLVTYRYLSTLNNRKMRDARSFFTEGVIVASWMMIAANPMLAIGILMLLSDRHWQTSFFDYSGGGDTVLFQHMFWFFGHPEVYVIMIPAFGFNNTILSFYLRKRVSARASLLYSMYTIAFLGFFVWGHHMYMVGLAHTTRMLFSTLTVMISVPAATKLMHWCVTLVNSAFSMELPFVFSLLFIFFFVSGGISGMAVAHTGMDILFHDSFYVIGHFHVMFAGSAMFASFGAFYFYFPAIFGVKYSRIWGYLHCIYYLLGQLMTVIPMFWLGYSGMPRRVLDYPASLGGWHAIVSAGHLLSVAGLMAFFIMIFDSLRQGRAVTRNSFGISRFNTRLNFYLYEIARSRFIQRKGLYLSRFNRPDSLKLNKLNYSNNELLETTLYSYTLTQK